MTQNTITLPEPIIAYIHERLADGRYASLSDYVSELISEDMTHRNASTGDLRNLLDEAEKSGVSERGLEEILDYARSGRKPQSTL
jgi:antitoxin ParD1/3/4